MQIRQGRDPQQRSQLGPEQLGPVEAGPHSAQAQEGVGFPSHGQVGQGLVAAHVQGPDHQPLARAQGPGHDAVGFGLFVLAGGLLAVVEQEFAPEQSDPLGAGGDGLRDLPGTPEVGGDLQPEPIRGYGRRQRCRSVDRTEGGLAGDVHPGPAQVGFAGRELQDAPGAVQHHQGPAGEFQRGFVQGADGGDGHGPGQDRHLAGRAAPGGGKALDPGTIQLGRGGRRQLLGDENASLGQFQSGSAEGRLQPVPVQGRIPARLGHRRRWGSELEHPAHGDAGGSGHPSQLAGHGTLVRPSGGRPSGGEGPGAIAAASGQQVGQGLGRLPGIRSRGPHLEGVPTLGLEPENGHQGLGVDALGAPHQPDGRAEFPGGVGQDRRRPGMEAGAVGQDHDPGLQRLAVRGLRPAVPQLYLECRVHPRRHQAGKGRQGGDPFAVGDDHQDHQAAHPGAHQDRVEPQQRLARLHPVAHGHLGGEAFALEQHRVQADVQEHFDPFPEGDGQGVVGWVQLGHGARHRRQEQAGGGIDGDAVAHPLAGEYRVRHGFQRDDDARDGGKQIEVDRRHGSIEHSKSLRNSFPGRIEFTIIYSLKPEIRWAGPWKAGTVAHPPGPTPGSIPEALWRNNLNLCPPRPGPTLRYPGVGRDGQSRVIPAS